MQQGRGFRDRSRQEETLASNINAAKAVADIIATSLGPRGMDKMIKFEKGNVVVTNDGATILEKIPLLHPCAKMMAQLSKAQDLNVGDGTTTVVVLAGAILSAAERLLAIGIHSTQISESFLDGAKRATKIFEKMAAGVSLNDRKALIRIAATSLNSKIVSCYAEHIAEIAVDSVMRIIEKNGQKTAADIGNIRIVKKKGGTVDDMFLFPGVLLTQKVVSNANGPTKMKDAKIGLIQFQLSAPKTDMDNQIVVSDYQQMDRVLKEERKYTLDLCKKIKASGCNVLLIQKSILRDSLSELAAHYLAKLGVLVITEIERDEIGFITRSIGCVPVAQIDSLTPERLGTSPLVEQVLEEGSSFVKIHLKDGKTASVLCRGTNSTIVDEAERSLHDSLCVVRSLVERSGVVAGGGAPEIEASLCLAAEAHALSGVESICLREYAAAFEAIPFIIADNCGLVPVNVVSRLKKEHRNGSINCGINIKKKTVSDMMDEKIIQPILISISAVESATETAALILKIDDWVFTR